MCVSRFPRISRILDSAVMGVESIDDQRAARQYGWRFGASKLIWQGEVEVFDLTGHPKAKRAYAWSHRAGKDDSDERFVAVLEIPPITSPETAVKVVIAAEVKRKK